MMRKAVYLFLAGLALSSSINAETTCRTVNDEFDLLLNGLRRYLCPAGSQSTWEFEYSVSTTSRMTVFVALGDACNDGRASERQNERQISSGYSTSYEAEGESDTACVMLECREVSCSGVFNAKTEGSPAPTIHAAVIVGVIAGCVALALVAMMVIVMMRRRRSRGLEHAFEVEPSVFQSIETTSGSRTGSSSKPRKAVHGSHDKQEGGGGGNANDRSSFSTSDDEEGNHDKTETRKKPSAPAQVVPPPLQPPPPV